MPLLVAIIATIFWGVQFFQFIPYVLPFREVTNMHLLLITYYQCNFCMCLILSRYVSLFLVHITICCWFVFTRFHDVSQFGFHYIILIWYDMFTSFSLSITVCLFSNIFALFRRDTLFFKMLFRYHMLFIRKLMLRFIQLTYTKNTE